MIKLPYGYDINADSCGYTLGVIKKDKKGKEFLANAVYPKNIKSCIQTLLEIKTREMIATEELTLNEAIKKIEKLHNEFSDLLNIIKEEI